MKFDFYDRVRKILTKHDMPYIVSWFVPEHFAKHPSEVFAFVRPGDQDDLIERLAVYLILLENRSGSLPTSDVELISQSFNVLDWGVTKSRSDIPVFFLVSRLIDHLYPDQSNGSLIPSDLTKQQFLQILATDGLFGIPRESLLSLDASGLPDVVKHSCHCEPFTRKRCLCQVLPAAEDAENVSGYLAKLPKSRDLAAELNRIQGPFILTSGMTSIVDAWGASPADSQEIFFVEVGAHFGDAALFACELFSRTPGKRPRVIAFDPNPEAFEYFRESVDLNNFHEFIDPRNIAIGPQPGEAKFTAFATSSVHSTLDGKSPFAKSERDISGKNSTIVKVNTLDAELADSPGVIDLLMIHTNGAELDVLYGASETLRRTKAVKIRFYAKALFENGNRRFLGEEKRAEVLRKLTEAGCGGFEWPEGGDKEEEPLLAQCSGRLD